MKNTALRPAFVCFSVMTIFCGVFYTGAVTGLAGLFFPRQAGGSLIAVEGKDGLTHNAGSALIGQEFTKAKYLIGRPMGTTNLSPVGERQKSLVRERIEAWHALDPENARAIPMDLVTASGSGVDPHISPEAAEYQVRRIARERMIGENAVRAIIKKYTQGRFLGIFGDRSVSVLKVNLALDGLLE